VPLTSALVCGVSPHRDSEFYQATVQLGLVHFFVISGAHLSFLQNHLKRLRIPSQILTPVLFVFCLYSGFGVPVVRAFLRYVLANWSALPQRGLWPHLWPSLFCLLLLPNSASGLSLALSWNCVVCLHLCQRCTPLQTSLYIYLANLPLLIFLQAANPLIVFCQVLFLPVFAYVLFPLTIVSFFLPWIASFVTPLYSFFEVGLLQMAVLFPRLNFSAELPHPFYPLLYASSFHCLSQVLLSQHLKHRAAKLRR